MNDELSRSDEQQIARSKIHPPNPICGCKPRRRHCKHFYANARAELIRERQSATEGDPEGEEELKPSPLPTFIDPQTGRVMLPGTYGWKLLYRRFRSICDNS